MSLKILENYLGTFDPKILKFTPYVGTRRPMIIKLIKKLPTDREYNVPGPDPNVQPRSDIPSYVGNYPYLTCVMCANLETFKDIHAMLTYLCHSKGEFILHPGSHEVCETFLPVEEKE